MFNQIIEKRDIPESVLYLKFGRYFNQKLNYTNLHDKLKLLVLNNYLLDKEIKNTIILLDNIHHSNQLHGLNNLNDLDITTLINNNYEADFNQNFIIFMENIKGNIIFEELCEKVFNPDRIQRLCKIYNIEFNDYLENV
jgi:hypothetical protein